MRFRSIAVLLFAAAVLGFAAPAYAASYMFYGSSSAPIKAEDNSDDGNAWFYGAAAVHDGSWLRNRYWYRDSAPVGNPAYVKSEWFYQKACGSTTCWIGSGDDRSADTNDGDWDLGQDFDDLDFSAQRGRVLTKVCENQNNSPDACSRTVIATLDY